MLPGMGMASVHVRCIHAAGLKHASAGIAVHDSNHSAVGCPGPTPGARQACPECLQLTARRFVADGLHPPLHTDNLPVFPSLFE
jgi:hypothetical protein